MHSSLTMRRTHEAGGIAKSEAAGVDDLRRRLHSCRIGQSYNLPCLDVPGGLIVNTTALRVAGLISVLASLGIVSAKDSDFEMGASGTAFPASVDDPIGRTGGDLVGDPAPALTVESVSQWHNPSRFCWDNLEDRTVVLEFWATWCGGCIQAVSHLNEISESYEEKGVLIVFVTDEESEFVKRFVRKLPMRGVVAIDSDRSLFKALRVGPIPRTVVINRDRKIAAWISPLALTGEMLDRVLAGELIQEVGTNNLSDGVEKRSDQLQVHDEKPNIFEQFKDEAAMRIVIGPELADENGVAWGDGLFVKPSVDVDTILQRLFLLSSRWQIRWETDRPEAKLRFGARMPGGREELMVPLIVPALEAYLGVAIKQERAEAAVYVVTAPGGPGPDLRKLSEDHGTGHCSRHDGEGLLIGAGSGFDVLLQQLEDSLRSPIVDNTAFAGRWNWAIKYEPGDTESLVRAAREQLGLVLTPERRTIEMVVVRKAEMSAEPAESQ